MRKNKLLNADISSLLSKLGHTDTICIADAGLPIPSSTQRIDLALTKGIPTFLQTLDAVYNELFIEKIYLAEEIKINNEVLHQQIVKKFSGIDIEYLPHQTFKVMSKDCQAIVRTGEFTPFANIILVTGVDFEGDCYE